jgi:hypothetical protein
MFASQVYARIHVNRPRLNVSQSQMLGDRHEMDLHFDPGKKRTDAVSGSGGKRNRCQSMATP